METALLQSQPDHGDHGHRHDHEEPKKGDLAFSVDDEPFVFRAELTPRQIMAGYAGIDADGHYLIELGAPGHDATSYEGKTDIPIPVRQGARFATIALAATTVS